VAPVDSKSLNRAQVDELARVNDRYLQWVSAVQRRLNLRGFPIDDELRRVVAKASDGAFELRICLHYLACGVKATPNDTPPLMTGRHGEG